MTAPGLVAGEGIEDEEMLTFEAADVSVMRYTFAPDAAGRGGAWGRRTEAFVNRATCRLFGMHPEELLARIATRRFSLSQSHTHALPL